MKPVEIERVEELCEEIWALAENGENSFDRVTRGSKLSDADAALRGLTHRGLARLAEVLFSQVLAVGEEETDTAACELEHILSSAVTESICTYLGHPPRCPHEKPIPPGRCCEMSLREMRPLIVRLSELSVGEGGPIVFITAAGSASLQRVAALGVLPGREVRLVQKRPSFVFEAGQTTIAIDPEIAAQIYVRRPAAVS